MGKLACQLAMCALALGQFCVLPGIFLPWCTTHSVGALTGIQTNRYSLLYVEISWLWSARDKITEALSKESSHSLFHGVEMYDCYSREQCVSIPLQKLYLSGAAMEDYTRLFSLNDATGGPLQVQAAFYGGMITLILVCVNVACGLMALAYLYYYSEGRFNKKLRKMALNYMAGSAFCLVAGLICYACAMMMMELDYSGVLPNMAPLVANLHGKGTIMSEGFVLCIVALIIIVCALMSQNTWKSDTGEWQRERHKMKHEFEKWESTTSEDSRTESESEDEYESRRRRRK